MRFSTIRSTLRDACRAPVRVAASVLAIALAIAAIGVFAVPGVGEQSLRSIAARDNLAHVYTTTTPLPEDAIDAMTSAGLEAVEGRVEGTIGTTSHGRVLLVGRSVAGAIDRLRVVEGRLPSASGEVAVTADVGRLGERIEATGANGAEQLEIVGIAETTWFSDRDAAFAPPETARRVLQVEGFNRIVGRHTDPTLDNLEAAADELRTVVASSGGTFTSFPQLLVDGAHPIEEDIEMVSFMIGGLGVVAGIVALILLASTANSIVTDRARDAAIMQALGGTRRVVRRELRRPAIAIGVVGTLIGLPLGIVVANVIARMVLTRFAGITPDVGVDLAVLTAGAAFGIVGARLVSGRVARRVTNAELATALRDRDAAPFGRRWSDRLLTRLPTGGLVPRMAIRAVARRRARAVAVAAQIAGAVAAGVLVAGLATSIVAFNTAELEAYRWETMTTPADPHYPFSLDAAPPGGEVGIETWGEVDGREVELIGLDPGTSMFDTDVASGTWLDPRTPRGVVVAERLALQDGYDIGDTIEVALATGPARYEVIGHHPIRSAAVFTTIDALAGDLRTEGGGDTIWATDRFDGAAWAASTGGDAVATNTVDRARLFAEDGAARDAILGIFAAIGLIVVAIAAIGVSSTVAMNLFERRDELATVRATGGERRDVRSLIRIELASLAAAGWIVGSSAGVLGAKAIMDMFATTNAVELGFAVPWVALPLSAVAVMAFVQLLTMSAARHSARTTVAVTLRAAT